MKTMKLKLDRDELTTITTVLKEQSTDMNGCSGWPHIVLQLIIRDVLMIAFLRKLLIPKRKYSVTLPAYQAECLKAGLLLYEIKTANPYIIALIEKVKSTPVI